MTASLITDGAYLRDHVRTQGEVQHVIWLCINEDVGRLELLRSFRMTVALRNDPQLPSPREPA
jgi:hypothetical protein